MKTCANRSGFQKKTLKKRKRLIEKKNDIKYAIAGKVLPKSASSKLFLSLLEVKEFTVIRQKLNSI